MDCAGGSESTWSSLLDYGVTGKNANTQRAIRQPNQRLPRKSDADRELRKLGDSVLEATLGKKFMGLVHSPESLPQETTFGLMRSVDAIRAD